MAGSLAKRLAKGGFWVAFGKAGTTVTGMLSSAFLTRILSPKDVGTYYLALSVVSFTALLAEMGLGRTVIRLFGEIRGQSDYSKIRRIFFTVLWLALGGITIVFGIYIFIGPSLARFVFNSIDLQELTTLLAIAVIPITLSSLISDAFRGLEDFQFSEVFEGLLRGVFLSIGLGYFVFTRLQVTLQVVLLVLVASYSINSLIAFIVLQSRIPKQSGAVMGFDSIPPRNILRISWPIMLSQLSPILASQGVFWILGAYRPEEEVALYGIAVKFATLISIPTLFNSQIVAPFIAELYVQNRKKKIERMLRWVSNLTFGYAAFVGIFLFLFSKQVLGFVYGEYYQSSALILMILMIGIIINISVGPCGQLMLMTGNQNTYFRITLFSGIIGFLISLLLVNPFGYIGAAFGQMIYPSINGIITAHFAYHLTGIKSWVGSVG